MPRYQFYRLSFTLAVCCLPLVFWPLALKIFLVLTGCVIVCRILRKVYTSRIDIQDRCVFITGCDTGLGFCFAQHLDGIGFTVFAGCLSKNSQGAQKLQKGCSKRLRILQVDVTKDDDVTDAFQSVEASMPKKGLWAVINNAGINMNSEVELTPVSVYEKGFNVNLYGALRVTRQFLPLIRQSKGRIINITSVHGKLAVNRYSNYAVAKHALETISDSLRLEMKKFGVHVAIVEPGMFAAGTSVLSQATIERQTNELEEMWSLALPDVRKTYSKHYMMSWLRKPMGATFNSNRDILRPVAKAVEHAVCSTSPRTRYLVDGAGKIPFLDEYTVLARLQVFLPTWITDRHIATWRQCDRME